MNNLDTELQLWTLEELRMLSMSTLFGLFCYASVTGIPAPMPLNYATAFEKFMRMGHETIVAQLASMQLKKGC